MPPWAFKGRHWARAITWAHSFWAIDRPSEPQLSSLLERDWPSAGPNWRPSAKPLPLSLAEFLVSAARAGGVVLCPARGGSVATGAFCPSPARRWMVVAGSSTRRQRVLSQRTPSHGAKMQRHHEHPHQDRDVRDPLSHPKPYAKVETGNRQYDAEYDHN